jgi:hypothetical protein
VQQVTVGGCSREWLRSGDWYWSLC